MTIRMPTLSPSPETRAVLHSGLPGPLRPSRALAWAVVLLLVSTLSTLLLVGIAAAADRNPCTGRGSLGGNTCRQDNPNTSDAVERQEKKQAKKEAELREAKKKLDQLVKKRKEKQAASKGVLSAFDVRDKDGSPISIYQIRADTGDWQDWRLKVQHFLVQILFQGNLWLVSFACWLISWALSFSLAALLLKPVMSVSGSLHSSIVVQMGLPSLFLTISGVVAAWHWMFGTRARGWGEMTASLVISALALGALATPASLLLSEKDGAVGQARKLAAAVAGVTLQSTDETAPKTADGDNALPVSKLSGEISRPITDALVDAFVTKPSMLLSYGTVFTGKCETAFRDARVRQSVYEDVLEKKKDKYRSDINQWFQDEVLKDIPAVGEYIAEQRQESMDWWTNLQYEMNTSEAWQEILAAGPIEEFEEKCLKGPDVSKKASVDKVGAAFFLVVATLIVMVFITVIVGSFLNSQFWIAAEAAMAKVALCAGILPGPGRAWLWSRATSIGKWLAMMVLTIAALAFFIVIVIALLNTSEKNLPGGITVRFIVIDAAAVAAFSFRKKLTATAGSLADRARGRMGSSPFGGQASPQAPAGGGRRGGLGRALATTALLATGGAAVLSTRGAVSAGGAAGQRGLLRGAGRLLGGSVRNTGRTIGVTAKGSALVGKGIGKGTAAAARAGFTPHGRQALRSRISRASIGRGRPEHAPGDVGELRDRMARLRAARTPATTTPARPRAGAHRPADGSGHSARATGRSAAAESRTTTARRTATGRDRPSAVATSSPPRTGHHARLHERARRSSTRRAGPCGPSSGTSGRRR